MRLAALAFGVLGGLVASLILGLGGLDAAALAHVDPRQLSLLRFGLFVIANFGILGAGLVLAAPLAGAILLLLGALAWVVAALVLRHGPDFVLITPPVLLLVAFALALVAYLRRPSRAGTAVDDDDYSDRGRELPPLRREAARDEDTDYDEPPPTQVRAGFFGQGGTAMPARVEAGRPPQPALHGLDEPREERWRPGSRRPPPRQKPMFQEEYDEDEETGFSRVARVISGILSFGLYAGLAGAAALVIWNLRTDDVTRPAAAKIDAQTSVAAAPMLSSAAPSSAAATEPEPVAPRAPILTASAGSVSAGLASAAALAAPSSAAEPAPSVEGANLITADRTLNDTAMVAPSAEDADRLTPQGQLDINNASAPELDPNFLPPGTVVAADEPPPAATDTPVPAAAASPLPFPMPAEIAAERAGAPPHRRTAPAVQRPPANDTGL